MKNKKTSLLTKEDRALLSDLLDYLQGLIQATQIKTAVDRVELDRECLQALIKPAKKMAETLYCQSDVYPDDDERERSFQMQETGAA